MSNVLFRPSNSDDGEAFISHFCRNCIHGKYERTGADEDKPCDILSRTMAFDPGDPEYPKEWIYGKNGGECTAFRRVEIDIDGNERDCGPIYQNPDQINLFP